MPALPAPWPGYVSGMDHEREIADLRAGTEQLQDRIDDVRAD